MGEPSLMIIIIALATVIFSIAAFSNRDLQARYCFSAYRIVRQKEWYRILTHGMLHGGYMHLGANVFVFWVFASRLQLLLSHHFTSIDGGVLLFMIYIGGLIFSSLPAILKHHSNDTYTAVGASGAVSAVLFASILMEPTASLQLLFLPIPIPAFLLGFLYILSESIWAKRGGSNIAHDAHIAGGLFGMIVLVVMDYELLVQFGVNVSNWVSTFF